MIGNTRWWAKDSSLTKIFGFFHDDSESLFVELIITLEDIYINGNANKGKFLAKSLIESLTKFETVFIAKTFAYIFSTTTPLSKYLQTSGLDILTAYKMVLECIAKLKEMRKNFQLVKTSAQNFVRWANEKLDKYDFRLINSNSKIEVQEEFEVKRISYRKRRDGEDCRDEPLKAAEDKFRVEVYYQSFDIIITSLEERFLQTDSPLYTDFGLFDPKNFRTIKSNGIPENGLKTLFNILKKIYPTINLPELTEELNDFANKWNTLKLDLPEFARTQKFQSENDSSASEQEDESISMDEEDLEDAQKSNEDITRSKKYQNKPCKEEKCRECPACCFAVLHKYRLYSGSYKNLYLAYKYILTPSVTQVSCKRSFSTLKYVFNRLRATLTQEHLEAFMMMCCEKEVLYSLKNEDILNYLQLKDKLFWNLLTCA